MLEDLIVAATNEALRKMEEISAAVHVQDYRRSWEWAEDFRSNGSITAVRSAN